MPTFDEIKHVPFTPEQAKMHIAALIIYIRRMEKRLINQYDYKIAEYQESGDIAMALKMSSAKQERINLINDLKKEIARMREIFGDLGDGKSRY